MASRKIIQVFKRPDGGRFPLPTERPLTGNLKRLAENHPSGYRWAFKPDGFANVDYVPLDADEFYIVGDA